MRKQSKQNADNESIKTGKRYFDLKVTIAYFDGDDRLLYLIKLNKNNA